MSDYLTAWYFAEPTITITFKDMPTRPTHVHFEMMFPPEHQEAVEKKPAPNPVPKAAETIAPARGRRI